ncbi:hypothetical protein [Streptomyces sp. NBC_01353]|uniref:hypothetical protein n=1 Tax=Streptomyces sp. NBC_01353 TaxID=2903835 RepID=UPI002E32E2AB|nr:hypothetical protein [Streptomyces sp. NBC_01353]
MRKIPAILATAALAGLGVIVPTATAQAAVGCSDNYTGAGYGFMYAYNGTQCEGYLGSSSGNDADWGNSSGSFQGWEDNEASSILNKGNDYEVKFYSKTVYTGDHICLARSEAYASDLSDDKMTNGTSANNTISSHQWVSEGSCSAWAS